MTPDLAWLEQSVPLWSLLAAMLTSPFTWSDRVAGRLEKLLDGRTDGKN